MRVIAVDWSGAAERAQRHIWLAEAAEPGRLVRLESGRDRASLADHLGSLGADYVVGLDFGFSFPAWFLRQLSLTSAPALWSTAAARGEDWLASCVPPFWGRPGRARCESLGPLLRRAERACPRPAGIAPKSVFQVGGAGAVGTGSIRGMPLLDGMYAAGASIWPFVGHGAPVLVEIYPRLLTGPLHKSSASARADLIGARYPYLDLEHARLAGACEDAFDAAASALVMIEHIDDLGNLPEEHDPELLLEGRIWHPAWRSDQP